MPGLDGTGPFGTGRQGRGLGPCGRGLRPFGNRLGRGRGFGGGRRFRNCCDYSAPTAGTDIYPYDKASLQEQKAELEARIKWLDEQLNNTKED